MKNAEKDGQMQGWRARAKNRRNYYDSHVYTRENEIHISSDAKLTHNSKILLFPSCTLVYSRESEGYSLIYREFKTIPKSKMLFVVILLRKKIPESRRF